MQERPQPEPADPKPPKPSRRHRLPWAGLSTLAALLAVVVFLCASGTGLLDTVPTWFYDDARLEREADYDPARLCESGSWIAASDAHGDLPYSVMVDESTLPRTQTADDAAIVCTVDFYSPAAGLDPSVTALVWVYDLHAYTPWRTADRQDEVDPDECGLSWLYSSERRWEGEPVEDYEIAGRGVCMDTREGSVQIAFVRNGYAVTLLIGSWAEPLPDPVTDLLPAAMLEHAVTGG
jgi:hypothetical protein